MASLDPSSAPSVSSGFLPLLERQLLEAAEAGEGERVRTLLAQGADASFQENVGGTSALMRAARGGHVSAIQALLESGAPWNAVDRTGRSAGDHAMEAMEELGRRGGEVAATAEAINEAFNVLLNAGIQAELILGASERRQSGTEAAARNAEYLRERVEFGEGRILDGGSGAVMMQWERALMEAHAKAICQQGGDILNIGFGMGIIDSAISSHDIRSHTIVEAHPDVLRRMEQEGWIAREKVKVVRGRWQDVLPQLGKFDGIFFDTYGEHYEDLREFHNLLPTLLKPDGLYSFFNGMCADSPFFHTVYCQLAALELAHLGLKTEFVSLPVAQCLDAKTWEGVHRRYWQLDTYFLPVCCWEEDSQLPRDDGTHGSR